MPEAAAQIVRVAGPGRSVGATGSHAGRFGYDAAKYNRTNADWRPSSYGHNHDLRNALTIARDKARDLAANDDYAKGYIRRLKADIIGPYGFTPKINPANRDVKFREKAKAVKDALYAWMEPENCSVSQDKSFVDLQNLTIVGAGRDGEFAYRIIRDKKLFCGIALQPMQVELLDETYNEVLSGDRIVILGVEYDRRTMRRLAYWFRDIPVEQQIYALTSLGGQRTRIPAEEVIFGFDDEYVNQARGISWMVQTMSSMRMLSKLEEATLVAARMRAMMGGFIKTQPGASNQYVGDSINENGDYVMELENGIFKQLPPGTDIAYSDTNFPAGIYPDFVQRNLQKQSTGLGVAASIHSGNYSDVNFSSERARQTAVRDNHMLTQEWFIRRFLRPVTRAWFKEAMLTGAIDVSMREMEQFAKIVWHGRRWPYVNPEQEMNANAMKWDMKISSVSQMILESDTPYEPEEVFAMCAEDIKLAKQYELEIVTKAQPVTPPDPAQNVVNQATSLLNGARKNGNGHHVEH